MTRNIRSRRFGGSGKPQTVADWVQHKKTFFPTHIENARFETLHEVNQYFSGDTLVCLECGVVRRSLGSHLHMHNMTADEYREKYNIPATRGLRGVATRRLASLGMERAWAAGAFDEWRDENTARFKAISAGGLGTRANQERGYRYALVRPEQICEHCGKACGGFPSNPSRKRRFCSKACNVKHLWAIKAFRRARDKPVPPP